MLRKAIFFVTTLCSSIIIFSLSLNYALAEPVSMQKMIDKNVNGVQYSSYTTRTPLIEKRTANMGTAQVSKLDKHISYYVLQQTIGSALKDIGTQIDVPVVIAANVKGKVAAGKYEGSARDILNAMVADLGLHWYYDGRSINISLVQDAVMHVIQLNAFTFEQLAQTLAMINLDTSEFPLRHDPNNGMIILYGPPKYVATVEIVAHHLTMRARQKPEVIRG